MAKEKIFKNTIVEDLPLISLGRPSVQTKPVTRPNLTIGSERIAISNLDDLQKSINALDQRDGGVLEFQSATYLPPMNTDINIFSNMELKGISKGITVIDFQGGSGRIIGNGTNIYEDGSLNSITGGGVLVEGNEGAEWLANVTALKSQFFINQKWHLVAAVTSNTTVVLAEAYSGPTIVDGDVYLSATPVTDVKLTNIAVKNSTSSSVAFVNARGVGFADVLFQDSEDGLHLENVSEAFSDQVISVSNDNHGAVFNNVGFCDFEGFASPFNSVYGVKMNKCRLVPFGTSSSNSNGEAGYNLTDCNDILLQAEASRNVIGARCVSGNNNIIFRDFIGRANTSSAVQLVATTDKCEVRGIFEDNGGWAVDIQNSNCDNNVILAPRTEGNTAGDINDDGTGTVIITESDVGRVDSSNTTTNHTGDTNETTLKTLTIPAGTMKANGSVRISVIWRAANTGGGAGTQTLKVKFGGTIYQTASRSNTSGSTTQYSIIEINNRNDESSQIGASVWWRNDGTTSDSTFTSGTTSSVNTGNAVTVLLTGQLTLAAHDIWVDAVYVDVSPEA